MKNKTRIAIGAGGTGGHLFPAAEIKKELERKGYDVWLITDSRGKKFARTFEKISVIAGGQWSGEGFLYRLNSLFKLGIGFVQTLYHMLKIRPSAVIGMGGYISVPVVLWGWLLRKKTLIHNADSVLGNANMLLAHFADVTAVSFRDTVGAPKDAVWTGLPLREDVRKIAGTPYVSPFRKIDIVVFGGSQGVHFLSRSVPEALAKLTIDIKRKLFVHHQVMEEEIAEIERFYAAKNIKSEVKSFFTNSAELIAKCSLFIGLSGASTVNEIGTIGRPAVFIPLNHKDGQQVENAIRIVGNEGARMLLKSELTPKRLFKILSCLFNNPILLETMQKNARIFDAKNNAALNVANLIDTLLGGRK
ncbi:MAG: UDP-N-acetylglucosamine--N-acetylmuramyl-(pentapeptide) pyrophosphoryl-undecaprenol N-acetylglucosamine transferase [Rickettsiales bacterium]|jgi:UDP-N-acetylglucosamine--N-acetylmuramyl-(pentapeptide) pyrophosphoryl-undecaprenol N-acetylglucosamine transferase|nr:UDP-N-acetylglucosamine--N-acetylmuramyl-(pentapeptide) pyrophosphoryl-undecaprenol N-acetylglucosamine transferase [Rickettsiales bacterium]